MMSLILSLGIIVSATVFTVKYALAMQNKGKSADNNKINNNTTAEHIAEQKQDNKPYYEALISRNRRSDDFLDLSGGLLGI